MTKCQDILIIMIAIIIAKYLNNYHDKYQHLGCFLNIKIYFMIWCPIQAQLQMSLRTVSCTEVRME